MKHIHVDITARGKFIVVNTGLNLKETKKHDTYKEAKAEMRLWKKGEIDVTI